jgi:hypothetical protein
VFNIEVVVTGPKNPVGVTPSQYPSVAAKFSGVLNG